MAIFLKSNRRSAYVQAETFCSILILKKYDLDNIKVNYPAVAKDIIKEAEKRQAETKEIEEAYKDEIWADGQDAEDQKNDLQRIYGTPPGVMRSNFSPRIFDVTSRRSSYQGIESSKEELLDKKFHKNFIADGSESSDDGPNSSFKKLKMILPKHHSENNLVTQNEEKKENQKSKFLKEDGVELAKSSQRKSHIEKENSMTKKVIHEDIENEDKASFSSESKEESKLFSDVKNEELGAFSPKYSGKYSNSDDAKTAKPVKARRERSMTNALNKGSDFRAQWKRSTTEIIKEDQTSPTRSHINKIVSNVDLERKLATRTLHRTAKRNSILEDPQEPNLIEYRRQGVNQTGPSVHKQRRLSRINLGKQLELSETLGLRLQWRVD